MDRGRSLLAVAVLGTALAGPVRAGGTDACAHFDYEGAHGPGNWAALCPANAICSSGVNQSPVDLAAALDAPLPAIAMQYSAAPFALAHNGHTVQATAAASSPGSITIGGTAFAVKQFHFHAPSEHQLDGKSFPAELHIVHADAAGHLAVVGIFLAPGSANATLAPVIDVAPAKGGAAVQLASFDLAALLPVTREYRYYSGSLTTPPCSEGVRWSVLETPVTASQAQLEVLASAIGFANNRPVQALNARIVVE